MHVQQKYLTSLALCLISKGLQYLAQMTDRHNMQN